MGHPNEGIRTIAPTLKREMPLVKMVTQFREPARFNNKDDLQDLLFEVLCNGASDTYFTTGRPVICDIHGRMHRLTSKRVDGQECQQILSWLAGDSSVAGLTGGEPQVAAYSLPDKSERDDFGEKVKHRFRVNGSRILYRGGYGFQIVLRTLASAPPKLIYEEDLDDFRYQPGSIFLPRAVMEAACPPDGCFYMSGATGTGKTTTFAAMMNEIVTGDTPIKGNIVTAESPVEFVFEGLSSWHSLVVQSEVRRDVKTFGAAVRDCMRRHPALIVIGEIRDLETADAALEAANTGHPVWGTVHANDVSGIIPRLISRFPMEVRDAKLFDILSTARLFANQMLARTVDGRRTPIRSYLVVDKRVREHLMTIKEPERIASEVMQLQERYGVTKRKAADTALRRGLISHEEAARITATEGGMDGS
jgi:defect-in-organelle-trafficking protein DotB